jgi:3-phosphoshikimate 1-carboxyvinyltransferase
VDFVCRQTKLSGEVTIPGSKSHTIRAVAIASLAAGESVIRAPLVSNDTCAAVEAYRALGAEITVGRGLPTPPEEWRVRGFGGEVRVPEDVIDVRNSGVTLRTALGTCALLREGRAVLTGDAQIRRRPAGPLAQSLTDLGADVRSTRDNGCAPFVVEGRLRGGETSIEGTTSQYVTGLLINVPLADGDSVIHVTKLNEAPYVEMTLDWLRRQGIAFENDGLTEFRVPGGQSYRPVDRAIPADWSSATFFVGAGALPGNDVTLKGLDLSDTQGDKAVLDYARAMGAKVEISEVGIRVSAQELVGCELDLNATPDALPMFAVLGCFAKGTTRLINVPQARIKESDRIAVMAQELVKMGARVEDLPDGLIVHESKLHAAEVEGHGDHRVVMALAVAGCSLPGKTVVHGAEAAAVTFPEFEECMWGLGASVEVGR